MPPQLYVSFTKPIKEFNWKHIFCVCDVGGNISSHIGIHKHNKHFMIDHITVKHDGDMLDCTECDFQAIFQITINVHKQSKHSNI